MLSSDFQPDLTYKTVVFPLLQFCMPICHSKEESEKAQFSSLFYEKEKILILLQKWLRGIPLIETP